jgi:hypothetical protein
MKDRIIDCLSEKEINHAVVQFNYKGWLVSFSQMFKPPSIAIFKGDVEIFDLPNVGFAIESINKIESEK